MNPAFEAAWGALVTIVSAYGLGLALIRWTGVWRSGAPASLAALLVGHVVLSQLTFALSFAQMVTKLTVLATAAISLLLGVTAWRTRPLQVLDKAPVAFIRWKERAGLVLLGMALAAFAGRYLLHALAPDVAFDSAYYHLGLVRQYALHGGIFPITDSLYAALSQGAELVYLNAYLAGNASSPAVLHLCFAGFASACVYSLLREEVGRVGALAAALLLFACPIIGMAGTSAYVDAVVLTYVVGTLWALEQWRRWQHPSWLAVAGLLAGFCYAVKYTAFLAVLLALLYVAWHSRRNWRHMLAHGALLSAYVAIPMAPWLLRNAWIFGNPAAPFFNRYLPNPYFAPYLEQTYRAKLLTYEWLQSYWQLPREWFLGGTHLQGIVGFGFLAAPLALLALRYRLGRWALLGAALFAVVYPTNIGVRFLLPVLAMLTIAMAVALKRDPAVFALVALLQALTAWPSVLNRIVDQGAWVLQAAPEWRQIATPEGREAFLQLRSPEYRMAQLVNRSVKQEGRILGYAAYGEGYSDHHMCLVFTSLTCTLAGDVLLSGTLPGRMPSVHDEVRFAPLTANAIRVVLANAVPNQRWTINELRVFRQGQELPRDRQWKLRGSDQPWFLPMAFDNQQATMWSAWAQSRAGTYVEIDFGKAVDLDAVEMQFPMDWYFPEYRIQVRSAGGGWVDVPSERVRTELTDPHFHRVAAETLLRMGYRYVVAYYGDFHFSWLMRDRDVMGLEIAGQNEDGVVFRIRDLH